MHFCIKSKLLPVFHSPGISHSLVCVKQLNRQVQYLSLHKVLGTAHFSLK